MQAVLLVSLTVALCQRVRLVAAGERSGAPDTVTVSWQLLEITFPALCWCGFFFFNGPLAY